MIFNEILNASVRAKMLSFEKVVTHAQMVIDTDFHTFAIHSDQHNYANNIKMIKGVQQLTLSPNILISLKLITLQFSIDGWTARWTNGRN